MIHEKTFKERLTVLVGDRGCASFERRTGISDTTVRQYLQGECLPTLKALEQIAVTNGVTVGWLIGEEPHPQLSDQYYEEMPDKSMLEIAQWIGEQKDGINYWEVLKAKLAIEYPDFKAWLREKSKHD